MTRAWPLALCLRLAAHGILQVLRDNYIANLHRLHGDAPGVGALSMIFCSSSSILARTDQDIRQSHLADHLAQGGLGSPGDGAEVISHFQGGFLSVPHHPEQHRVYIDWDWYP